MVNLLFEKIKESAKSVLPITLASLLVCLFSLNDDLIHMIPLFLIGSVLLAIGMCLFDLGANISLSLMGDEIGAHLTSKKNIPLILIVSFIIGTIVTIAEPDLTVLASEVPTIDSKVLIGTVGVGVGLSLLIATFRMLFQLKYGLTISLFCILSFILAFFVNMEFVPLAFDSGGVTTGALTVPFIIALGAGLSKVRGDSKRNEDTFGLMSFCSIGPIIIVLILGLIYKPISSYEKITVPVFNSIIDILKMFKNEIPIYLKEVMLSLSPILLLFLIYNFVFLKLNKKRIIKIFKGLLYVYAGLVIFFTGVNVGFLPVGYLMGKTLADKSLILIFLGLIFGFFIILGEPAVNVLTTQIEELTHGRVKKKIINISLCIGVSLATCLAIIRVITGIPILYILLPFYIVAIILSLYTPPLFVAIAFDSGGVASGTMSGAFLLPFAIGICEALGKNIMIDAFGLVAIVAAVPLITVQLVGIIYNIKGKHDYNNPVYNEEIIDYEEAV